MNKTKKDDTPKEQVEEIQDKSAEEEQKSDKNEQQGNTEDSYGVKVGEYG